VDIYNLTVDADDPTALAEFRADVLEPAERSVGPRSHRLTK